MQTAASGDRTICPSGAMSEHLPGHGVVPYCPGPHLRLALSGHGEGTPFLYWVVNLLAQQMRMLVQHCELLGPH